MCIKDVPEIKKSLVIDSKNFLIFKIIKIEKIVAI
jgi:hypothetical protein